MPQQVERIPPTVRWATEHMNRLLAPLQTGPNVQALCSCALFAHVKVYGMRATGQDRALSDCRKAHGEFAQAHVILLTCQLSKTGTSVTFSLDFGQDIIG
jgi:hypothetical protein